MTILFSLLSVALAIVAVPAVAHAAYTGPQDIPQVFTTAREVREFPIDDHEVALKGHIIKRIGHDKYLFRDATSSIRLEIDAPVFPKEDFDDKTLIRIRGEVDSQTLNEPQIDVDHIDIVK